MFASLRIATLACIGLGAGLLASPRLARAELPGGATIEFEGPYIHRDNSADLTKPNTTDQRDYFNAAHCLCADSSDATFREKTFAWQLSLRNYSSSIDGDGEIWFGSDCSTTVLQRDNLCTPVLSFNNVNDLTRQFRPELSLKDLMSPRSDEDTCPTREGSTATWVLVDTNGDSTYEYSTSKALEWDTEAPELPTKIVASPGEGSVLLKWTNPNRDSGESVRYQFFCAIQDQPALSKPSHDPEYQTAEELCGATGASARLPFSSTGADAPPAWLSSDVSLDRFICGETAGTANETHLRNLRAGFPYHVAIIAVDEAGNAAGAYVPDAVIPTAVIDFWEDLHEQGGDAEGGLCLAATAYGDDSGISRALRGFRDDTLAQSGLGRWMTARYYELSAALTPLVHGWALRALAAVALAPLVALALLWHFLTLPGCMLLALAITGWRWRRRGRALLAGRLQERRLRRAAVAAAALAMVMAAAGTSSAQSSLDPYWDDDGAASAEDPYAVHWHAGIRLGPYTPAIDAQFGADPGPYEQMFGGYAVMPMLDVDYIFMETGLGQLGAGGSIGYMTKSAKAYQMDSMPGPGRPRTAEDNYFRMVPMAATAVFRLTYLDDKLRVPIVPYVRGGLAYYFWWTEAPDGGVSSVCREGGDTCDENKGRGGSLGLVGSIGLAVRAENIDFEAASAMREGGIQHAGFYAEIQAGKVDDFGVGDKLSVGDITWFAGVDFEF